MLAIIYLAVCLFIGYMVCSCVVPEIFNATEKSYGKKTIYVSPALVWIPAVSITGILLVTWSVYILAYFFQNSRTPLAGANAIALAFYVILGVGLMLWKKKKNEVKKPVFVCESKKCVGAECIFLILCLILTTALMFYTFGVKDGSMYIGYTVYSDFSPHLSMIRSFSYGNNFPTWYPYYAGIDVKYHFMFQFLVGNLEFLGMRIDYAFNIPSIISMIFVYMLLYVLAVKITGKRLAGYLTALLFTFRSSESLFTFLSETAEGESWWQKLKDNTEFIGYTTHEDWGLWNLNVYANQRHLALCLAILILVLILVLPRLYETFEMWKEMAQNNENTFKQYFVQTFFTVDGWKINNYKIAIFIGFLSGASAFWNGAALIALLIMLFFIAAFSRKRLDFVIMAGIAGILSVIQSKVFMLESSISPQYYFGFIAETKNVWGVASYILKLVGILAVVVVAAFMYYKGVKRYLTFVFATPFIFAFTVSMTIDSTANHKYIMLSCMLLNIIVANFIADIVRKKDIVRYIGAVVLVVLMISTGVCDTYSIYVRNGEGRSVVLELQEPVTEWVAENADSKDIFLTPSYTVNRVTLGGAMLYNGWPYFAWSAGYDTVARDEQVIAMYSATSSEELVRLVNENDIRYIVVDYECRASENYTVREDVISSTFGIGYTEGEGDGMFTIYDTHMILE